VENVAQEAVKDVE
jgi:hypothetical protein